jgi:Raf kinase inhibitor-like YbhB/YbcL family protein
MTIRGRMGRVLVATVGAGLIAAAVAATPAFGATRTPDAVPAAHCARPAPWTYADPYRYLPKVPSFALTSTTVANGCPLPRAQLTGLQGGPGSDISPQLSWSGFPKGTKSFVVSMYDPEAATGSGLWHWVLVDVPATTTSLPEGAGAAGGAKLPAGAFDLNGDVGLPQYVGAAPPPGSGTHHYTVTVTALDVPSTGVTPATSGAFLGNIVSAHTLARASMVFPTHS